MDEQTGEFRSCVRIECGCVIGWRFSILKISWKFQEDSKSISACPPNPCPVPQSLAEALTHYVAMIIIERVLQQTLTQSVMAQHIVVIV